MDFRDLKLPYLFNERFELTQLLGSGGMGWVFKAHDQYLSKDIAIKISNSELSASQVIRFQKEAIAIARLKHDNIVDVFDFGLSNENNFYLTMELLEGLSLKQLIKRKARIEQELFLNIVSQIIEGLCHAHKNEILHRDVKPSNIMLISKGEEKYQVKLVDFGVAKFIDERKAVYTDFGDNIGPNTPEDQALTRTGTFIGSPYYVSPEQALGKKIDQRADIYSVGCLMFEALTGSVPFKDDDLATTVGMRLAVDPPKFKVIAPEIAVDSDLENMVMRCLVKEPEKRVQTAGQLKEEIDQFIKQRSNLAFAEILKSEEALRDNKFQLQQQLPLIIFSLIVMSCLGTLITAPLWIEKVFPKKKEAKINSYPFERPMKKHIESYPNQKKLREFEYDYGVQYYTDAESLPKPRGGKLEIEHGKFSPEVCEHLAKLNNIRNITLEHCIVDDNLIEAIANWKSLQWLHILGSKDSQVSLEAFKKLEKLSKLKLLYAQSLSLTNEHIKVFEKIPTLEFVSIAYNHDITSDAFTSLRKLKKMTHFKVGNKNLSMKATVNFINDMPKLRHLGLMLLPNEKSEWKNIERIERIDFLDMSKCHLPKQDFKNVLIYVSMMPNLRTLDLSRTYLDSDNLLFLNSSPKLEKLILKSNKFSNKDLENLAKLKELKELNLRKNNEVADFAYNQFIRETKNKFGSVNIERK